MTAAVQTALYHQPPFSHAEEKKGRMDTTLTTRSTYNPRDVHATIRYLKEKEDGSPLDPIYFDHGPRKTPPSEGNPRMMKIHDIRGTEDEYSLDKEGFQILKHSSAEKDFVDDDQVRKVYHAEIEELLKKATGGSRVFIFDHIIRGRTAETNKKVTDEALGKSDEARASSKKGPSYLGEVLSTPTYSAHVDYSYSHSTNRVRFFLPDEADELLKHRFQIINTWRPLKTVRRDPFGVATADSVPDSDLVPLRIVYPERELETIQVKPSDGHKWYYLYKQSPEEVLAFKIYDSKTNVARRVVHSAFVDEEFKDEEPRESIEARALVFFDDDAE